MRNTQPRVYPHPELIRAELKRRLTERQFEVYYYHYQEDKSQGRVAQILRVSLRTVAAEVKEIKTLLAELKIEPRRMPIQCRVAVCRGGTLELATDTTQQTVLRKILPG